MRKPREARLLVASVFIFSISGAICVSLEYLAASIILLISALCFLFLWVGIVIGLSGQYRKEDFYVKRNKGKSTEVN